MDNLTQSLLILKHSSSLMSSSTLQQRNHCLLLISNHLSKSSLQILETSESDYIKAHESSLKARLLLTRDKLMTCIKGLLINLM